MMKPKDIRDLVHTSPFKPFRLHLMDGKNLRVPHPDFVLVTPELVVVATELPDGVPGDVNLLPYESIARVEMLPRRTRKAA
ncbi:MAG: hypothetical protein ABIR24_12560 [Verrucomicrobiota bacterium]